ncbi:MAG: S-layer homology domain-containing protein [Clostridia bacterium]|nr:S-layer homology domain-containing protein [Clostridia bacterium]
MKKYSVVKLLCALVAIFTLATVCSAAGFTKTNSYTEGTFSDVPVASWYATEVASSYELGFMNGKGEGTFAPDGNVTVAEAITMASRVHAIYNGKEIAKTEGKWYDMYVQYALANGIIAEGQYTNYDRNIMRYEMAVMFADSMPASYFEAKNDVKAIPDVDPAEAYHDKLMMLYKAGVVMGSTEYGDFLATNSIKRSETAAIINRVALPENRQVKTLKEYGDRDQAVYLIDDYNMTRVVRGLTYLASGWNYENLLVSAKEIKDYSSNALSDVSDEYGITISKDIVPQNHGLVSFEAIFTANAYGTDVVFADDEGNNMFALSHRKDGVYACGASDKKTPYDYKKGKLVIYIQFDLDEKKARVVFNGEEAGTYELSSKANNIASVAFRTGEKEILNTTVNEVHMYTHYAVNDRFIVQSVGKAPFDWSTEGDVKVDIVKSDYDANSVKMTGISTASKKFRAVSDKFNFETYVKVPASGDVALTLKNSGADALTVNVKEGKVSSGDVELRDYSDNIWQSIRVEVDTEKDTALIKVNGKKTKVLPFTADSADEVVVSSTSKGFVHFDDVQLYNVYDYADYVPVPVPVTDDEWIMGMSVCSLWHEGTHYGWDCISPYDDVVPVLGFYDEGLSEVADWEIKMLVEHGYDFQHFCWYYGSELKDGIKMPRLGYALNEGYMNAKYSDMQDFMIMWENASGVSNFEEFKKTIWPYWVDWYFTDSRYLRIDNKAVLTIYIQERFIENMGGLEGAKAAIDFMNEEIKKYGYDGMIILATGDGRKKDAYINAEKIGIDAYVAYHFGESSYSAKHQKNSLDTAYGYGHTPFLASIGIGFNDIGWTETRTPLATLESHTEALTWAKDEYMPKVAKMKNEEWMGKFILGNTWNEFGEGHYMMPAMGLHGFGYLDDARKTFSSVAGTDDKGHFDVEPTINQKSRLGYMYVDKSVPLRREMYVDDNTYIEDNEVVIGWNFEEQRDCLRWGSLANTTAPVYDAKEKALVGSTTTNDGHIHSLNMEENFFDAKDVRYMRIRIKTENANNSTFDVFFIDKTNNSWSAEQGYTMSLLDDGEYHDYYIDLSTNALWKGTIRHIRFDPMNTVGKFFIKSIEFLSPNSKNNVVINASGVDFSFNNEFVEADGEDVYVAANPSSGFYYQNAFYYEWSKETGSLMIKTYGNHVFNFTVGSNKALVDGKEKTLKKKITLVDGLVMLPITFIYDEADYEYEKSDKRLEVYVRGVKVENNPEEEKPYRYEFNSPGNTEGWAAVGASGGVLGDGSMLLEATPAGDVYDPIMSIGSVGIDASIYNKAQVRFKALFSDNNSDDTEVKIYFSTLNEGNLSESKTCRVTLENLTPDADGYYILEFDFSKNEKWTGTILDLRFDSPQRAGSYWIDYIRFIEDPAKLEEAEKAAEEAKKKQEIINAVDAGGPFYIDNADAEIVDSKNNYGTGNSKVTIVEDPDNKKNHVYLVEPKMYNEQVWTYIVIPTRFKPGVTYKVEFDYRTVGDGQGNKTGMHPSPNFRYTDLIGGANKENADHVSRVTDMTNILPEDGWMHYETTYTVNETSMIRTTDHFTIFVDSILEGGKIYNYSYMIDNIKVSVVAD